jgi:hypothetical protein
MIFSCAPLSADLSMPTVYLRSSSSRRYRAVVDIVAKEHVLAEGRGIVVSSWTLGHASHVFLDLYYAGAEGSPGLFLAWEFSSST